ncbi:MAG: ATP-binding cassette domain-containing protein [Bacilli bacterium]|nr:ATP-binding cassette domain-containing protein [Bacilli bacterium]
MIEIRNLVKIFFKGTPSEKVAIDHLNLTLQEGDFVTVIGGNGAGKSTLINLIAGSLPEDEGMILLNNNDICKLREHQRAPYFGRVFQDPKVGTATDMTIIENLALAYGRGKPRSLFRWSYRKKDVDFFTEQLKTLDLGLEDRLYQKVGLLSGGQRQALTLLMATIRSNPSYRRIKRDYVWFYDGDKKEAKIAINKAFDDAFNEFKANKKEVLSSNLSKNEKKNKINELKNELDKKLRQYDVTKPVLLLDEHTAALDPKTAQKVLEITDKIVKENNLTTIMITHNMKDAIKYGNRLIMMSKGKVVADVAGEEKQKLTIEALLDMFTIKSKNDIFSDSAIFGD